MPAAIIGRLEEAREAEEQRRAAESVVDAEAPERGRGARSRANAGVSGRGRRGARSRGDAEAPRQGRGAQSMANARGSRRGRGGRTRAQARALERRLTTEAWDAQILAGVEARRRAEGQLAEQQLHSAEQQQQQRYLALQQQQLQYAQQHQHHFREQQQRLHAEQQQHVLEQNQP